MLSKMARLTDAAEHPWLRDGFRLKSVDFGPNRVFGPVTRVGTPFFKSIVELRALSDRASDCQANPRLLANKNNEGSSLN